ncbi:hypothetical protein BLL40_05460 [Domibacillus mangrovi]|uniref:Uncharacterized protein n=1 Tax=Domibacillus mangrovi TaxID=1714354 RepID=A0A1Q5P4A7_9BACI|nr:hypothetical protein BLL40_05460 [Domibacillus mangrovi]
MIHEKNICFFIMELKKGVAKMNGLLLKSKEEKWPIEIMYMALDNTITKRRIIVTSMDDNYIKGYCFTD